jgi:Uma2 family endonuclease
MLAVDGEHPYFATMMPSVTAEELQRLRLPGKRTELVRGRLVVREPAGLRHGLIAGEIALTLGQYVKQRSLGRVCTAEPGFKLEREPDTVRAPDVAFIRSEKLPDPPPEGYAQLAPDLVVEVVSPNDRPGEVLAKVGDWLNAGTRMVWVVDPGPRRVRVYRADGSETVVSEEEALNGEDVVPGFRIPVASIL